MQWTLTAFLYPATDLPDVWIGHCLNLDVVTQGKPGGGPESALEWLVDAVTMIFEAEGGDAFKNHAAAPREIWERRDQCLSSNLCPFLYVQQFQDGRHRVTPRA